MPKTEEFYDVILTDIQFHTQKPAKPRSFLHSILRSIRNNKPGRAYSTDIKLNPDGTMHFSIPLESKLGQEMERAKRLGKQIRILTPKIGVPVYLGKDAEEKLDALKKRGKI